MGDLVKEIERVVEKLVDIYEEDDPKCDFGVYRMRTGKVVGDTITTLQRARDAITKAQGELVQLSESTDSMGHPVFARQLMDIHDMLSAYTPEEK